MEKFKSVINNLKQWWLVFGCGLALGIVLGGQTTYWSIVKDCQVLGMFRLGDSPVSCTYHLVEVKK